MGFAGYRAGMAQILVEGGRPQANLDRAVDAVRQAAARGCRLVLLPECLVLGCTDPSARELAQPVPGPHADRLAQAARHSKIHVPPAWPSGRPEPAMDRHPDLDLDAVRPWRGYAGVLLWRHYSGSLSFKKRREQ